MGARDDPLLDAYSQTVSGVVERAGPSVASVRVFGAGRSAGPCVVACNVIDRLFHRPDVRVR